MALWLLAVREVEAQLGFLCYPLFNLPKNNDLSVQEPQKVSGVGGESGREEGCLEKVLLFWTRVGGGYVNNI